MKMMSLYCNLSWKHLPELAGKTGIHILFLNMDQNR